MHLLDALVSTNDAPLGDAKRQPHDGLAVSHIEQLLPPLAALASSYQKQPAEFDDPEMLRSLTRDAWFNLITHDFLLGSQREKASHANLRTLALFSPPLIDMDRADTQESGLDLNTVLRRGMSQQHAVQLKTQLVSALPAYEADIRGLDYAELTFLHAAHLVAVLRAQAGDCTRTMVYFLDPKFKSGPLSNCLLAIALNAVDVYLEITCTGRSQAFAAPQLAQQLARFFEGCCHRIDKVQHVAIAAADRIISQTPSALCQKTSLFAMLELLSLMWTACLEMETNEYEWRSEYHSAKGNVKIQLSDDFAFRQQTLRSFQQKCRKWIARVTDLAPLDLKGLLQTYLSDYEDEGAYGHVALGRSFAVEVGSLIPATDQRLGALGRHPELSINTASDFIAQYTTRQEYRTADVPSFEDRCSARTDDVRSFIHGEARIAAIALGELEQKLHSHQHLSLEDVRSPLRKAASILCNVDEDRFGLINLFTAIPFALFTKQSIKLGISLWMGVIKENAALEPRILAEITLNWEGALRRKRGIFSQNLHHPDPFFVKQEFAPSDRAAIAKKQQVIYDMIAPHFRLVQFLSSHFSATRLSSTHTERAYFRLMRTTLPALRYSASHPLAREAHFHIVLLALRVLGHCTGATENARWALKDQILSAGLSWFSHAQRYSFGSNKLQIKAEVQIMQDVLIALQNTSVIGAKPAVPLQSLLAKQELLAYLLGHEMARLNVWISPLGETNSHFLHFGSNRPGANEATLFPLVKVAWTESPSLAVQLALRSNSQRILDEVRWKLVKLPEKAIDEPDALQLLLGSTLPNDISFQLKVSASPCLKNETLLTTVVLVILGSGQPDNCGYLLHARIWQPPLHHSICHAGFRKSFR